eukprot:NODE_169_length_16247_cov_0.185348.p6 type:complete len:313 gc:universal NODE_169_length_16247_cov_0.185348:1576-2514(+)
MLFLSLVAAYKIKITQVKTDIVAATFTNDANSKLSIVLPNTPMSNMDEDVLQVRQNGKRVNFVGQHVQWDFSDMDQMSKEILPGETWVKEFSVSQRYDTDEGLADVRLSYLYRECEINGRGNYCTLAHIIQSNDITMNVKSRRQDKVMSASFKTKNCYFKKWLDCKYVFHNINKMQESAIKDLQSGPSKEFITFFGTNDTSSVLQVFNRIQKFKYDIKCNHPDCQEWIYAFVYPKIPTINVCSQFFKSGNNGWNSKLGTIIHELTHFIGTGSTEDYAYGVDEAMELALENPALAMKNADNYGYFAESVYFKK